MKVLVCGSRDWENWQMVAETLDGVYSNWEMGHLVVYVEPFEIIHGDNPKGADKHARWWAENAPADRD